ncbi:hypothetical protein R5W24_000556 [Gemmata sp. JC717]|uniref:hypothetical protein n=1 Tax=Gemmata algarum TaxID=2975278 RepID=UPI0021BBB148|nr:hypothetical protein [Gemmata algarum]MDY3551480.1 hypothetical protein [Gemmata algarum]
MSNTDQFILFVIACFAIGTWWRMAIKGMTFGEAAGDTIKTGTAPLRFGAKVGKVAYKHRRWWW